LAMLIFIAASLVGSSTFFVNAYLFYQQPFSCNGVQSPSCTQHVCTLPLGQQQQYLPPQEISTLGN
jgi:hypothetical protein